MSKISDIYKERQLIGCFLISRESINAAIDNSFTSDEFVDEFNKKIAETIFEKCRFETEFIPTIDWILDNLNLKDDKAEEARITLNRYKKMIEREIINKDQILDITNNNIEKLRDYSIKRKVIYTIKNSLENIDLPAREFISLLSKDVMSIEINDGLTTEIDIYTGFKELKKRMEYQKEHGTEFGFTFDLRDLDILLKDQIAKGTLTYIVGRPSNYKSGLALNLAQNISMKGIPAAILSNEMEIMDVYRRILARVTRIEMNRLKNPRILTSDEWARLDKAIQLVIDWPLYVIDSSKLNIAQIDATVAYLKSKYGVEIVLQDYMQLIRTRKGYIPSEESDFGEISEELRMIAKNHNIALISLTQANRGPENRDDKRPTLRDIRNSGKLEQDAHNILYVYRDEFYYGSRSEIPNHLEVGALKIREGELKRVILHFNGACATLGNADPMILEDKSSDYIGGGGMDL